MTSHIKCYCWQLGQQMKRQDQSEITNYKWKMHPKLSVLKWLKYLVGDQWKIADYVMNFVSYFQ